MIKVTAYFPEDTTKTSDLSNIIWGIRAVAKSILNGKAFIYFVRVEQADKFIEQYKQAGGKAEKE